MHPPAVRVTVPRRCLPLVGLLAALAACGASAAPPTARASVAAPRARRAAPARASQPSGPLADPGVRAAIEPCDDRGPETPCGGGCERIAGRCRRVQGGISQPEVVGGADPGRP